MSNAEIVEFISRNSGLSIEFGTKAQAPSPIWIDKAERVLGQKLPEGYRWFLENYGGGEIHGDEIYSIYERPFDEVTGGDVVAKTLQTRSRGSVLETDILICYTDFGEAFALDCAHVYRAPVVRIVGDAREIFAEDFCRFIVAYVGDTAV